jgi:cyclophilin family peptidyl-prolyl cis-trans isomerase/HEAT repeat protein
MPNALTRAASCAAVTSLAGCASLRGTPVLAAPDASAYAQLLAVADARIQDTAVVLAAIRSTSAPLRRAGALAAGQVHIRSLAPGLRELLRDSDTTVAARAAFSLDLLRDTAGVPALDSALGGAPTVAVQAAFALGDIGEASRTIIVRRLATQQDPLVKAELLLAAAKLRPVPAAPVIVALSDADPCVRWAAAYALTRPRVAAGVRPLLGLLNDLRTSAGDATVDAPPAAYECAPSETRAMIARALAKPATGDSLAGNAFTALRSLVADPNPHVRINALRSIATFPDSGAELLIAATRDADANVRVAAAQSLSGRQVGPEAWSSLWSADTGLMYRRSLLESATRAGAELPAHREWASATDWHMRAALADAAAQAPTVARATALATPLLGDPDPRVRQSAFGAIAAYLDSTASRSDRRSTVLAGLDDPDFFVRATALLAVGDSARASEVPAVLRSYRRAAADSGNDARIAAIRYIASAWRRDSMSFSDSLRHAVSGLPAPDDPLVRAEAQRISILSNWPGTQGERRDAGWYESIVRNTVSQSLRGSSSRARIETARGPVMLELLGEDAPLTVANFERLARAGYYRNVRFHRVVPNFVAQDGDPRGDGNGGPGYAIRDELNVRRYTRGAVGMALSGPDTGGSQYFLTLSPQPHLDARYTIFARVIGGEAAMDALVQGDAIHDIVIVP